jgi:hypothetical protein
MKTVLTTAFVSFLLLIYAPCLFVLAASFCGLVALHSAKDRKHDKEVNWNGPNNNFNNQ